MKLLVPVKRVIDPYVRVRVKPDNTAVVTDQVKMAMNPFDEIALEAAIQLKEKGLASSITIVSIGLAVCQETLRHGLALGADNAILVETEKTCCSLTIAKILKKIGENESPHLIIMGKQSIDGDNNQTPQMLASLLDWPQATYASKIELNGERCQVTREVDAGVETIEVTLPAVISVDLRLNTPRYASLPNIMQAKRKPLTVIPLESLGLTLKPHIEVVKMVPPETKKGGVILDSVDALIEKLQREAKIL